MVFQDNEPGIVEFKDDGDEVEGTLIKIQENVGPSNSMLYTLEIDGKPMGVWGSAILDQRMVGIKLGDLIKIKYKGLGEAQSGKNAPKIFKVMVDRPESSEQPNPEETVEE